MARDKKFSPLRFRREEHALESRLRHIEEDLSGQPLRVQSNDDGSAFVEGSDGVTAVGGGSGGSAPASSHELLNDAYHSDVLNETPVSQDLLVRNASGFWARLAVGTTGYVLKVVGGLVTWAQVAHSELSGIGANDHHNQSHVLATGTALGGDHTISGAATGEVLRALTATTAAFDQLQHSDLGGVTANQHHNQAHNLFSADHTGDVDYTATANSGDILYYNGTKWTPVTLAEASVEVPVTGWGRADTSTLNTTYEVVNRAAGTEGGQGSGILMRRTGSVTKLVVTLGAAFTTGTSLDVKVRLWDDSAGAYSATELEAVLTTAGGLVYAYAEQAAGVMPFDLNDRIEVWNKRTGAINARSASYDVWVAL